MLSTGLGQGNITVNGNTAFIWGDEEELKGNF